MSTIRRRAGRTAAASVLSVLLVVAAGFVLLGAAGPATASDCQYGPYGSCDETPPVITTPTSIDVDATGPDGAVVTYTVTATDDTDPAPTVVCWPPSDSMFPIGDTTVQCTATDASSNQATASFVVRVNGTSSPANDDFADATGITSLPFSDSVGIVDATIEPGEPLTYFRETRTVWWTFTAPGPAIYRFTTSSDYPAASWVLYEQNGSGFGGLTEVARLTSWAPWGTTFTVSAGKTYYVQTGDEMGYGWVGSVSLTVDIVAPPPNDDFANAIGFGNADLPFNASGDLTAATMEPGEPTACGGGYAQTMWYAFTPSTTGAYGAFGVSNVAVYTGTSLGALANVACADWPGLYFHADAGTTYYLQVYGGSVSVDVLAPPAADFTWSPGDPSALDEVQFSYWNGGYWDPTVTGYSWTFGDGAVGTGSPAPHRYAKDGDYTVTITVEARGDRTNTATKTVQVRTHDVAIMSLVAPSKSRVGKTGVITVGIGNTRYPETVQVDVYKITPQGNVLINTGIQSVAVKKLKKTTAFSFNYTFTTEDRAAGKVNFQAVATIQGARDALTSDNTATSTPTLVTK